MDIMWEAITSRCVADGNEVQSGSDAKTDRIVRNIECPFCGAVLIVCLMDNEIVSVVCEELE